MDSRDAALRCSSICQRRALPNASLFFRRRFVFCGHGRTSGCGAASRRSWWQRQTDMQDPCQSDYKLPFAFCRRFVFCRQRQDERLRRGGEQKSVVVLSMYPYSSVLGPLCQFAGPLFFNHGENALEEVGGLRM